MRRCAAVLALSMLALSSIVLFPTSTSAAGSYTATADARLVGVDFTAVPSIAFDQLIDAGVSVAQAQIDSIGTTDAFASTPYPSNSVVLLPGLIAGVSGGSTSSLVPPYPLIAASNGTTPSEHRQIGTVSLDAESTPGGSRGTVTDGATSGEALTTADDAKVVAHAETSISSLQLSSSLALEGIHTVADATRPAGGPLQLTSSFGVAAITILGQRIALTPSTLSVLGHDVPLKLDPSSVLGQLVGALAAQGTTFEYVPAVKTTDGITAAGLRITTHIAAPPQVASGLKELPAQITLGLASVSLTSRVFPPPKDTATVGPGAPTFGSTAPTPSPGGALPPVAMPSTSGAIGAVPSSPSPALVVPGRLVLNGHSLPVDISLDAFYPVLVLATAIGIGLTSLIRHLGVRSP